MTSENRRICDELDGVYQFFIRQGRPRAAATASKARMAIRSLSDEADKLNNMLKKFTPKQEEPK